jgi:hypothetical protein
MLYPTVRTQYKLQISSLSAIGDLISSEQTKKRSSLRVMARGLVADGPAPGDRHTSCRRGRSFINAAHQAAVGQWQPRMKLDEQHALGFFLLEVLRHINAPHTAPTAFITQRTLPPTAHS